jgi:hypothetical protein
MKKVIVLFLLMVSLSVLNSCGGSDTQTPMPNPNPNPNPPTDTVITLTFSASDTSNYTLEKVEGASTVGMAGMTDPEITLGVGKRYRVINQVLLVHSFVLSGVATYSKAKVLLTDTGEGSFVDDAEVKFVKNSDGFSFTLTSQLAAELKSYICFYHTDMLGLLKVTGL